jgi:hypothetical protein
LDLTIITCLKITSSWISVWKIVDSSLQIKWQHFRIF